VAGVLGAGLVGCYVHGSAVLGGYDVRRSDLDVLVVCRQPMSPGEQGALAADVSEEALPCPAIGLELSVVTSVSAAAPVASPAFELHVTTAARDRKVVDGHRPQGDADLVLHYAVCRAAGRALGDAPPPAEVFAPVPEELILTQLADELTWALAYASGHYTVLNACRAWQYAEERVLASKLDGGEWARARTTGSRRTLVETALARQRGDSDEIPDRDQMRSLVNDVRATLEGRR
jgi:hypothetical protein